MDEDPQASEVMPESLMSGERRVWEKTAFTSGTDYNGSLDRWLESTHERENGEKEVIGQEQDTGRFIC